MLTKRCLGYPRSYGHSSQFQELCAINLLKIRNFTKTALKQYLSNCKRLLRKAASFYRNFICDPIRSTEQNFVPCAGSKIPPAPAGKIYVTKRYPYRRSLIYSLAGGNWAYATARKWAAHRPRTSRGRYFNAVVYVPARPDGYLQSR